MPPISSMLMREAEAWRALLSLHSSTVSMATQTANASDNSAEPTIYYDEKEMNSESRQAAYCAALTGLASQCDNLFNEVLKLRTFRKARREIESKVVREIVRSHSDEVMAIGQALATNSALSISSATAELRIAIQSQRNQIQQLRILMEALSSAEHLPLPRSGKLMLAVRQPSDSEEGEKLHGIHGIDDLFARVYQNSRELNETSISKALSEMLSGSRSKSPSALGSESSEPSAQHFARRPGDRAAVASLICHRAVSVAIDMVNKGNAGCQDN